MKVVRVAFLSIIALLVVILLVGTINDLSHDSFPLVVALGSIFLAPFLEVPLLAVSVWGILQDKSRRPRYIVTAILMIAGLIWAYVRKDIPFP